MLPFPLIYHGGYDLHLGDHVFPSQKFRLIRERMLEEGFAAAEDFVRPEPAGDDDLLLAHEPGWIDRLTHGTLSEAELLLLEIPYSQEMVRAFRLAAGGTILAARQALERRVAFNIGGGFHHGFADHGEGFCAINDIAVAIRKLQREAAIRRAMVVDCDVHHGNGTAAIFAADPSVFTISLHQFHNYPAMKPKSTIDVHLKDGTGDAEYLQRLSDAIRFPVAEYHPDLLIYVAGADPYCHDQLGGLKLTLDGLICRDRLVMETARQHSVPVVIVTAGGYALDVRDTVTIHVNTAKTAKAVWTA